MTDWGDVVDYDNEDDVDDLEESAEPLETYFQPPFYCPIRLGEVLAKRYRIEHKLGHGGFSTVWMAHDTIERKDVALKVTTLTSDMEDRESTMHDAIHRRVRDKSRLLLSHEFFSLNRGCCHHKVLVFPLRGPNLHSCFARMSMADRMSAAKQVLEALKCLHDANIVHRDLNDTNIVCGIAPLDSYDIPTKYQYLGRPLKMCLKTPDGISGEIVKPRVVPPNLLTKSVYLADFGIAITAGTSVEYKPQSPSVWCAPERFHKTDPSAASDMWSYMVVFAELYLGSLPWSRHGDVLSKVVNVLGPLPQTWSGYYHEPAGFKASWYDPSKRPETTLEVIISNARPDVSLTERALVLDFMLKGFIYNPQHRITSAELLRNSSFQALMAIYSA